MTVSHHKLQPDETGPAFGASQRQVLPRPRTHFLWHTRFVPSCSTTTQDSFLIVHEIRIAATSESLIFSFFRADLARG